MVQNVVKALDEYSESLAAGSYRLALPAGLHGEVPARFDIERDGARLERNLLISLPE